MDRVKLFKNTLEFKKIDRAPVWLMRQAGRYQKEYLAIREKYDFLTMCKTPELAAEVSLLPKKLLDIDGIILFSDILTALEPLGVDLKFSSEGPVIDNPIRDLKSFKELRRFDSFKELKFVSETLKILKTELEGKYPLFGFSGAPFTLASYMIEGKTTKNHSIIKKMMNRQPELLKAILDLITEQMIDYLKMQVHSGADYLQLFDTWAGVLSREDYLEFALPYEKKIITNLQDTFGVKIFLYINGSSHLLDLIKETKVDVISLDWRCNINEASLMLSKMPIQGNLDPTVLYGDRTRIKKSVKNIFEVIGRKTGHVFNLGHGILPDIDIDNVRYLIECVKEISYENYR